VLEECDSLASVTIPDGVTTIKPFAFRWCDNLTSVIIPVSTIELWASAFYYCDKFTDIYYKGTEDQWAEIYIVGEDIEYFANATIHYNYTG
jgi:hypothetical protein